MEELIDADEVFCTGTAVVISPVGSVTYQDKRYLFKLQLQLLSILCFYILHVPHFKYIML